MTSEPERTALVLIEFQNDFTSEGGALHGAVEGVMESTNMLENTKALVEEARAAGATIIHAPISFADGYHEISDHPYGILAGVVDSKAFVKDSWGADIVDDLSPKADDIVIEGKRGLDTFASTNLDFILRSKGIDGVALGHFLAQLLVVQRCRARTRKIDVVRRSPTASPPRPKRSGSRTPSSTTPMFSDPIIVKEFAGTLKGQTRAPILAI